MNDAEARVAEGSLLLPEGALLLHIGPQKTGTTAIQGALFRARPQLAAHGVLHAGRNRNPRQAVLAFRGVRAPGAPPPRAKAWDRLVDQVTSAAGQRVILSAEAFADADAETARRAVQALGGSRVHVVVTLRPLTKILSSQWQQYVRNRIRAKYDDWLVGILQEPPDNKPTPTFWHRHHHDLLVERWAAVVGPENVTVIVLDETDRDFLLRTFEDLVGIPRGLLVAGKETENRSLSLGEIELVRQMNIAFRRRGWSDELYERVVVNGLSLQMRTNRAPSAGEPRIVTPQWALDRAAEIGAAAAEKLSTLGVRIVGDISSLGAPVIAQEPGEAIPADSFVAVEAAREAVLGTLEASGLLTKSARVESTSTKDLVRVILARGGHRARKVSPFGRPLQP